MTERPPPGTTNHRLIDIKNYPGKFFEPSNKMFIEYEGTNLLSAQFLDLKNKNVQFQSL